MSGLQSIWLCLKIRGGMERRAHERLEEVGMVSRYPHIIRTRRVSRHSRRERPEEVPLLTGYALVAHDGSDVFEGRLRALCWHAGRVQVVQRILGVVPVEDIERVEAMSEPQPDAPQPARLRVGDRARLLALYDREVRVVAIRGDRVEVLMGARLVHARAHQLERVG